MIIDAHAHIFPKVQGLNAAGPTQGAGYGRIRMGDEVIQLLPPFCAETVFTPEMLIAHMDWAGVEQALLLQGPFYGACNDYALAALAHYPDRLIGAAYVDPWEPTSRATFAATVDHTLFRAVKLECSEATGLCGIHPQARLDDAEVAWLWPALEERGLVLVLDLGAVGSRSYQTAAVRAIAERHPGLKIIIAHLGQPTPTAEADPDRWQRWQAQIQLGLLPNVWFDTAALPAYLPQESFPYPSAARYLHWALEQIGPHKILWGTDLPGLLGHATYRQLLQLGQLHTQHLSSAEQALVLGGNAAALFGLAG
ncbi:MAG: amidohydrolase [Caldilineaceae bacterium]|nr:amidohydrolase [Caldilineaceae bacterium]